MAKGFIILIIMKNMMEILKTMNVMEKEFIISIMEIKLKDSLLKTLQQECIQET